MSTQQAEATAGLTATIEKDPLAYYLDSLLAYVDEAVLNVTDTGLESVAVDAANVGCVDVEIDSPTFDTYTPGGTDQIGVNLERLRDVVDFADDDEPLELNLNPETRKLEIRSGGMTYTLALIDPGYVRSEPDIPDDLPLEAEVTLEAGELARGLDAASMASDYVRISSVASDPDQALVIEAYDTDKDDARLALALEDLEAADPADASSMYSITYLESALDPLPKDSLVTLRVGDDVPMKLSALLPEGEGRVLYMIAPRLDKEGI